MGFVSHHNILSQSPKTNCLASRAPCDRGDGVSHRVYVLPALFQPNIAYSFHSFILTAIQLSWMMSPILLMSMVLEQPNFFYLRLLPFDPSQVTACGRFDRFKKINPTSSPRQAPGQCILVIGRQFGSWSWFRNMEVHIVLLCE
jgi:hypothetical protein